MPAPGSLPDLGMSRWAAADSVPDMETVADHVSAARLFVSEALTLDPRMSDEKLMAAQAEATLAVATALDGIAAAIREGKGH
jgi:hypothetical protein